MKRKLVKFLALVLIATNCYLGGLEVVIAEDPTLSDPEVTVVGEVEDDMTDNQTKPDLDFMNSDFNKTGEANSQISVRINEFLPMPDILFKTEFVELYNYGEKEADLSDYYLDDIAGGGRAEILISQDKFPEISSFIIKPGGYLCLFVNSVFNNDQDEVRLLDPNKNEIDKVIYKGAKKDRSYSLIGDAWYWTIPTPESENILQKEEEKPTVEKLIIGEVKGLEDGSLVKTEGIVSVLPGYFSTQYFYIQDQLSGIQVYSYRKLFPSNIAIGDKIEITGQLSSVSGERRIKTNSLDDFKIISNGNKMEPIDITGMDADALRNLVGQYVSIKSTIATSSRSEFVLAGSPEIKVVIKEGTGIKKPPTRKGNSVEIKGVLSIYNQTFRVLPIFASDVIILTSDQLIEVGPNLIIIINFSLAIYTLYLLWNILLIVYKKRAIWLTRLPKNHILVISMLSLVNLEAERPSLPRALQDH